MTKRVERENNSRVGGSGHGNVRRRTAAQLGTILS